ncbi:hypothetical protein ACKXGF_07400 [Alkalibacillus sp. S2W]|uniref:hypothetical protein n=1 Tax=Alkalibacillus sp. S2W TaxID=3386553 RepID=UPI00398D4E1A
MLPEYWSERFYLLRNDDETGVSGTGIVATGVVLPSGKAIMEWLSEHTSVAIYESIEELEAIHGHNGRTVVKFY